MLLTEFDVYDGMMVKRIEEWHNHFSMAKAYQVESERGRLFVRCDGNARHFFDSNKNSYDKWEAVREAPAVPARLTARPFSRTELHSVLKDAIEVYGDMCSDDLQPDIIKRMIRIRDQLAEQIRDDEIPF